MPDFIKPLYDLDVVEGKEAVLKCKVAGLPYPTITWFHNGKRIESTEDRKMTQCKSLQMDQDSADIKAAKTLKQLEHKHLMSESIETITGVKGSTSLI